MRARFYVKLFILFIWLPIIISAAEYHVDQSADNMVKFISDAPIESFEGVTDKIDGYLYYEGDDLSNASALYFEVDLNSIDTGIGLRNRHMREKYLETGKKNNRFTHFKGEIIKSDSVDANQYNVVTEGNLFIHGVSNKVKVEGNVTKESDRLHIKCAFPVKLSDYDIEIPSIMFYKIDETMQLELDIYVKKVEK